jgi:predicted nucleic acid-binding protein
MHRPIHYFDSCIFITWLGGNATQSKVTVDAIGEIVRQAETDSSVILTSAMTHAEILRGKLPPAAAQKLDELFKRTNVQRHETDFRVWNLAHDLRDFYDPVAKKQGQLTLSLPDAVHLATAILCSADVLYTTDRNCKKDKPLALIPLNGRVADKYQMRIEMPVVRNPRLDL